MGHYTQFHSTNFSADTVAHMTAVFEEVCAELGLKLNEDQLCEVVAQEIVKCADAGHHDPIYLQKRARTALRMPPTRWPANDEVPRSLSSEP